jgi:hypothetical protein
MALSYNPGVVSTAGESLGRGLSNLGMMLGDALSKRADQQKQLKDQSDAAAKYYKSLGDDAPKVTGYSADEFANMSAAQQISVMKGSIVAQAQKEQQARMQAQILDTQQAKTKQAALDALTRAVGGAAGGSPAATGGSPVPPGVGVAAGAGILSGAPGGSPAATGGSPVPPGQNDFAARLLAGIQANPAAVQTPEGQSLLMQLVNRTSSANMGPAPEGYIYAPDGKGSFRVVPDRTYQAPVKETKLDDGTTIIEAGGRTRFVVPTKDKSPTEAATIIQKSISAVTSQLNSPQTDVKDKPLLQKKLDDLNEQLNEQLAKVRSGSAGSAAPAAVDAKDPLGLRGK